LAVLLGGSGSYHAVNPDNTGAGFDNSIVRSVEWTLPALGLAGAAAFTGAPKAGVETVLAKMTFITLFVADIISFFNQILRHNFG